ncbi:Probable ubiquitin-conjugating enzyme E2 7 (E2 ubiquitin-conjugating enzyme 7) (Ubiquitin carrier protein 7) (Ubiquitin-protein ligase 7) [Durusdinium trenchii]
MDLNVLPRANELLPCFPVRVINGRSMNALPIIASVVRRVDFETLERAPGRAPTGDDFLLSQLEQRWLVLHNLSKKQRRMVKFFEVRDMNGASISTLLTEGATQLSKIKNILSIVQDFYPEMIHQVAVLNSTSSFSGLFNFLSLIFNERMKAKIKVRPTGIPFEEVADLMEAKAIHSFVEETCGHLCWSHLLVPSGGNEFLSRWLKQGQKLEWTAILEDGADVMVHTAFLPQDESQQEELAFIAEEKLFLRKAITSEYEAPAEGRPSSMGQDRPNDQKGFRARSGRTFLPQSAKIDFDCDPWPSFPQARDLCQQLLAFQPEESKEPPEDGSFRFQSKVHKNDELWPIYEKISQLMSSAEPGSSRQRPMAHVARELLKKELVTLMKDESCGFSVGLEDDSDFFTWRVVFEGPAESLYEGGIFTAILKFPSDFPNNPPEMRFETEMWHPNIYPDGRVCISILHPPGTDRFNDQETADERWRPILGVHSILISVMSMLVDPNVDSPANIDAAVNMKNDYEGWKKKVRQLTRKSVEG